MSRTRRHVQVVIADPRPASRATLSDLFRGWGWTVVGEAQDGLAAVRLVRHWEPDLLIVEASVDGLSLVELQRLVPAGSATQVVGLVDVPQQLASPVGTAVLKGLASDVLRSHLEDALTIRGSAA